VVIKRRALKGRKKGRALKLKGRKKTPDVAFNKIMFTPLAISKSAAPCRAVRYLLRLPRVETLGLQFGHLPGVHNIPT